MTRFALTGGDYQAASIIASCQRCVNLYVENMDPSQGEPSQATRYPTPGLTLLGTAPGGILRGVFRATNGDLYCASGLGVYYVSPTWTFTLIGSFQQNTNFPVIFVDNGVNAIVVQGNPEGWTFTLAQRTGWTQIGDSGWLGATYIDWTDTFFIVNSPKTPIFYISASEDVTFDPLDFASKTSKADNLVAAVVSHRVIWLIGVTGSEVWSNTGGGGLGNLVNTTPGATAVSVNTFPFEAIPGVEFEDGCAAVYSIAKTDTKIFFLAQNATGGRYVLEGSGYKCSRISTPAIEAVFAKYSVVSDAIGYCYMQRGHYFYVLSFPTADATWCFDTSSSKWHERVSVDNNGNEHRYQAGFHAFAYDMNIAGDWSNGNIYAFDLANFTENGTPIKRLQSFPQQMDNDNNARVLFRNFTADIAPGDDINPNDAPLMSLRWSDDRGASWGNPIIQVMGATGAYNTNVKFNRLGYARTRVFELSWSTNSNTALNGAFLDVIVSAT